MVAENNRYAVGSDAHIAPHSASFVIRNNHRNVENIRKRSDVGIAPYGEVMFFTNHRTNNHPIVVGAISDRA